MSGDSSDSSDSSSGAPPASVEAARDRLVNGGVYVEFTWHGDRFGHVVGLVSETEPTPILRSLEGNSLEDWPPSPPLQQLSIEDGPGGERRAFLVGMAGKSHWSLVVEPIEGGFLFDAALRCKVEPDFRGSCYTRLAPSEALTVALDRLDFNPRESMAPLDHPHYGPSPLSADETSGREPWFVIGPGTPVGDLPATFQWRYRATIDPESAR